MTIDISNIDLIWRGIAGLSAIIVFVLILREQKKTTQFLKEDLNKHEVEIEDERTRGEWVKMEDVQKVMPPILKRFYNATDGDIEYIIQEIEQKAYLIE